MHELPVWVPTERHTHTRPKSDAHSRIWKHLQILTTRFISETHTVRGLYGFLTHAWKQTHHTHTSICTKAHVIKAWWQQSSLMLKLLRTGHNRCFLWGITCLRKSERERESVCVWTGKHPHAACSSVCPSAQVSRLKGLSLDFLCLARHACMHTHTFFYYIWGGHCKDFHWFNIRLTT